VRKSATAACVCVCTFTCMRERTKKGRRKEEMERGLDQQRGDAKSRGRCKYVK